MLCPDGYGLVGGGLPDRAADIMIIAPRKRSEPLLRSSDVITYRHPSHAVAPAFRIEWGTDYDDPIIWQNGTGAIVYAI